jgi:hypothetical protein
MRLYWAKNDGMGGHVFLGPAEVALLSREMLLQGMTGALALEELEPDARIGASDLEAALEHASTQPVALADRKLWADWLAFLEGAAANGGVVVR